MPTAKSNKSSRLLNFNQYKTIRFVLVIDKQTVFAEQATKSSGSSALIVVHKAPLSRYMMQQIARQTKFPATVFFNVNDINKHRCLIRWFNQNNEINRCGHGTLAAALFLQRYQGYCPRLFYSRNGEVFKISFANSHCRLNLLPITSQQISLTSFSEEVIKTHVLKCYSTAKKGGYTTVIINDERPLTSIEIDTQLLANYETALIVLKQDTLTKQWYFRYFAPYYGVNEDQATGSALSVIAPILMHLTTQTSGTVIQSSANGAVINYRLHKQWIQLH